MKLEYKKSFLKQYARLPLEIKKKAKSRVSLFQNDAFNPLLRTHKLDGKYFGCRSINITGDYRAIFYDKDGDTAVFIAIGTHAELYG